MRLEEWGSSKRFRRYVMAAAVELLLLIILVLAAPEARVTLYVVDIILILIPLGAGISCFYTAARWKESNRNGWALLGAATIAWSIGQTIWSYYELVLGIDPFPSLADAGYLLFLPLAAAALVMLGGLRSRGLFALRTILDGGIIALGLLYLSWMLVLGPIYAAGPLGSLAEAIGLAYPLGDVILAALALTVATRSPTQGRAPIRLVLAGIVALAVSDSLFAYATTQETYATGSLIDVGWMAGFMLLGLAAAHPDARHNPSNAASAAPSLAAVLLPYVLLFALVALSLPAIVQGTLSVFLQGVAAALFGLLLFRQALMIMDNLALNRSVSAAYGRLQESESFRTELLHTFTHDLSTPLSAITLQTALLKNNVEELPQPRRNSIAVIDRNAQQMSNLLHDLSDISRMQSGRLVAHVRETDLSDLVRNAVDSFRAEADLRHVTLAVATPDGVSLQADPERITQVVYNLLSNALKFTPAGGAITVAVEPTPAGVTVSVRDQGRGLSQEEIPRLFQAFSQVHRRSEVKERGSGLGLYICRGIVEEHGGRIWAESPGPGKGSIFSFQLPLRPLSASERRLQELV